MVIKVDKKIDVVVAYKPIKKILENEEMSLEKRVEMTLELVDEILEQAEK